MRDFPITVKRSIELLGLFLIGSIIVIGSNIIMPVLMAFFISILLLPVLRFLKRFRVPEALAIFLSILMLTVVVAGMIWFFSSQIGRLIADFPQIQRNVSLHLQAISSWINEVSDFSTKEQLKFIGDQSDELMNNAGNMIKGTANSISSTVIFIGLLPIYVYLILFYKNLLLRFVFMWFSADQHEKVEDVLRETESIIKSYLLGLLIQISYITVLLGGILLMVGIDHAILIGAIFAILNLIPYVGALIGNLIGVLLTLTSSQEIWPVFAVLGIIAFVQFLDNNILMPRIVGSKVKINALGAILGVIIGGSMAGISGMFLSLPIIAVLKVIFDRSNMFKHWGVLLGDEKPEDSPMISEDMKPKKAKILKRKPILER